MRQTRTTRLARETSQIVQDTVGALSLCVTFLAVLYLPGLF